MGLLPPSRPIPPLPLCSRHAGMPWELLHGEDGEECAMVSQAYDQADYPQCYKPFSAYAGFAALQHFTYAAIPLQRGLVGEVQPAAKPLAAQLSKNGQRSCFPSQVLILYKYYKL